MEMEVIRAENTGVKAVHYLSRILSHTV